MPLEPPLTASAQDTLKRVREQIDAALEALVADMLALATAERDTALSEAQAQAASALEKARADSEAAVAEQLAAAHAQAAEAAKYAATSSLEDRVAAIEAQAAKTVAEVEERAAQALTAERAEAERRVAETQAQAAETAADIRAHERQCDLACLERLVDAIRDFDAATTLSQVLDKLADHAATHVARVAVLVVRPSTGSLRLRSGTPGNVEGSGRGEPVEPRDRELRGWRLRGFGDDVGDPSTIAVSLDAPTVVRQAVETGSRATTGNGAPAAALEPPPFASLPDGRIGLALPLTVGVRTVAVLYADEDPSVEPTVPSGWPEILEMLARHAACRLEMLTMARAYGLHAQPFDSARGESDTRLAQDGPLDSVAGSKTEAAAEVAAPEMMAPAVVPSDVAASVVALSELAARRTPPAGGRPPSLATDRPVETARAEQARQMADEDASALRYARLLISEIKLYHEDAVNEGRRDANLLARLGQEIARARRLYEERVPAEVRGRADHFGQELVRTLANGDPRLLGQAT